MPYYESRVEEQIRKAGELADMLDAVRYCQERAVRMNEVGRLIREAIVDGGLEGKPRPTKAEQKKASKALVRALKLIEEP